MPHGIVAMDTNGRILAAARDGMTQRELAEQGNVATDSQLALLEAFGLLDRDGDRYRTAFALVGPKILSTLRPRWRAAGARLPSSTFAAIRGILPVRTAYLRFRSCEPTMRSGAGAGRSANPPRA